MKIKTTEIDFTKQILVKTVADEKATYPAKCNPGNKESPDKTKCIATREEEGDWKKK